jgi:hypothetical protein
MATTGDCNLAIDMAERPTYVGAVTPRQRCSRATLGEAGREWWQPN